MDTHDHIQLDSRVTQPWNKGKLTGAKPPLGPKHVWAVRTRLQLLKTPQGSRALQPSHRQQTSWLRPCRPKDRGRGTPWLCRRPSLR